MTTNKFFLKLLIVYITLFFVFAGIISTTIYNNNKKILHMEMETRYRQVIEHSRDKMDSSLTMAFSYVDDFFADKTVANYFSFPGKDYYAITKIYEKINLAVSTYSSSGFVLGITKLTDGLVITPSYSIEIASFFNDMGFKGESASKLWEFIDNDSDYRSYYTIVHKSSSGTKYITVVKKIQLYGKFDPIVFVSFVENSFMPNINSKKGESFILRSGENIIDMIGSHDINGLEPVIKEKAARETRNNEISITQFPSQKATAYTLFSNKMSWQYDYIVPDLKKENNPEKVGLSKVIFIYLGFSIISILLAFTLTKTVYRPISNMLKVFGEMGSGDSRDELRFINDIARRIKHDNEDLLNEIKNNKQFLKDKFIRDMLIDIFPADKLTEGLDSFDLSWLRGGATIVVFDLGINEWNMTQIICVEHSYFLEFLGERLKGRFVCELLKWDSKSYVALIKSSDIANIREVLTTELSKIEEGLDIQILAAIGGWCSDATQLSCSLKEALSILSYRFVNSRKSVITIDEFHGIKSQTYYYSLDSEKALIANIFDNNGAKAKNILNEILNENLIKRRIRGEVLSQFIFSIITTLNRILQQIGKNVEEIFGEDSILYLEFKMCQSNEQLKEKICQSFETIIAYIDTENLREDNEISNRLLEFLYENYNKDISLNDFAEHFNLSPGYVGKLFKRSVGENFKDYLNIYRVQKAKELLLDPKLKVSDVAEMVGCNSIHSFIRIFKRYEGVSPGEYKGN